MKVAKGKFYFIAVVQIVIPYANCLKYLFTRASSMLNWLWKTWIEYLNKIHTEIHFLFCFRARSRGFFVVSTHFDCILRICFWGSKRCLRFFDIHFSVSFCMSNAKWQTNVVNRLKLNHLIHWLNTAADRPAPGSASNPLLASSQRQAVEAWNFPRLMKCKGLSFEENAGQPICRCLKLGSSCYRSQLQ